MQQNQPLKSDIPSNWDVCVDRLRSHPEFDPAAPAQSHAIINGLTTHYMDWRERETHQQRAMSKALQSGAKPRIDAQVHTVRIDSADELAFWAVDPSIVITDTLDYGNGTWIVEYLA